MIEDIILILFSHIYLGIKGHENLIIDGILALHISSEIVPDLAIANIEHFIISDFIFSSQIDPQLIKPSFNSLL